MVEHGSGCRGIPVDHHALAGYTSLHVVGECRPFDGRVIAPGNGMLLLGSDDVVQIIILRTRAADAAAIAIRLNVISPTVSRQNSGEFTDYSLNLFVFFYDRFYP